MTKRVVLKGAQQAVPKEPTIRIVAVVSIPIAIPGAGQVSLTLDDFVSPTRASARDAALRDHARPALSLGGRNARQIAAGLDGLRKGYGKDAARAAFVSPGFGLVSEAQTTLRTTFSFRQAERARIWNGAKVQVALTNSIEHCGLVVFMLSRDALAAVGPLPRPGAGQRFIAIVGRGQSNFVEGPQITVVPTDTQSLREFGAGSIDLKGRLFELFSAALVSEGTGLWERLLFDDTADTFLEAVRRMRVLI
jgi:hypothetical protein